MHTLTLVFSLLLGMEDYPSRMFHLCRMLETGLPSAPGITVSMEYHRPKQSSRLRGIDVRIFVDCLEHLQKANMDPSDIPVIRAAILAAITPLGISLDEFALESIDYCQNMMVPNARERRLAMRLWHKTSKHFLKAVRIDRKNIKNENYLYYKCQNDFYRVQLYSKQDERADKGLTAKPYESGVLRLEYQLRKEHLLYHWRRYGTPCSFDAWADWSLRATYLKQTERLFSVGTFTPSAGRKPSCEKRACPQRIFRESGNS